jgi:hypothetical protein
MCVELRQKQSEKQNQNSVAQQKSREEWNSYVQGMKGMLKTATR